MHMMTSQRQTPPEEIRPLTISELERATSTPRSTIYYYVRDGLLPAAQKAAASRAVYSDVHVEALREIRRLKRDGVPLDEIRERIRPLVERASGRGTRPRGAAHAADPRRDPAGRGAAVRPPRLPAHPHRRHHQGRRHHAAGLLRPLQHQAAALHRGVQRVRPLDERAHRAAAGRRTRPGSAPHHAHVRLLGTAAPEPRPARPGARRGSAGGRGDACRRAGGPAHHHQRTDPRPRGPAPRSRRPAGLRRAHGLQPVRRHARRSSMRASWDDAYSQRDIMLRAPLHVPRRRGRLHRQERRRRAARELPPAHRPPDRAGPARSGSARASA